MNKTNDVFYEIGQKVIIKKDLIVGKEYNDLNYSAVFDKNMEDYKGSIMTIKSFNGKTYKLEEDTIGFHWISEMFDPLILGEELTKPVTSEKEIPEGKTVKFKREISSTPLVTDLNIESNIPKQRKALVMFSGGFDSVALAIKVIESGKYDEVTLLYEQVTVFDDHEKLSENIWEKLVSIYKNKEVSILFETINLNLDWTDNPGHYYSNGERDLCLMIHLTTVFGKGQYGSIYLGWNKSNIETLNYSKEFLSFFEKYRNDTSKLYFLEEMFLEEDEGSFDITYKALLTKRRTVRLLLEKGLFSMCSAEGHLDGTEHWYNNSGKWKEVVNAIIDLGFTSQELSKVFRYKDLNTVQKIWNKKNIVKKMRVTNKAEMYEEECEVEVEEVVES